MTKGLHSFMKATAALPSRNNEKHTEATDATCTAIKVIYARTFTIGETSGYRCKLPMKAINPRPC